MEGNAKSIFPVVATGWPAGAVTALLVFPYLRRVAAGVAGLIERT